MMLLICGLLFVLALASLLGAAVLSIKKPTIALCFEGAAVGCVIGMVQTAAVMHGLINIG